VIDTLRADRVGAFGYPIATTPVIDRLAAAGALAEAHSPTSWTKPSIATLLTGLHPLRHQVISRTDALPPEVPLLAGRLRELGFRSFAVSSNAHVAPVWGFDRGFDTFVLTWKEDGDLFPSSEKVNLWALRELARAEPPFFGYVHYLDPHSPYDPKVGIDGLELPPELRRFARIIPRDLVALEGEARREAVAAASALYDAEIRSTDRALGELLDVLANRGLADETLVVVTSDHGEGFDEHGLLGHGKGLFEELTKVPLAISWPAGIAAGQRIDGVALEDVVPTVLDLLGAPSQSERLDGRSFAGLLTGTGPAPSASGRLLHLDGTPSPTLAWVRGREKLILAKNPYAKLWFDLGSDPREIVNRVGSSGFDSALFAELAAELAERHNDLRRRAFPRVTTSADRQTVENLGALGYLRGNAEQDSRSIPRRIRPADARPGGLLGFEDLSGAKPCVDVLVPDPTQLGALRSTLGSGSESRSGVCVMCALAGGGSRGAGRGEALEHHDRAETRDLAVAFLDQGLVAVRDSVDRNHEPRRPLAQITRVLTAPGTRTE
jgi:arylsulfatase A-like enzyme